MHWGSEYQLTENSEQQKLRASSSERRDAIIGSHPHVVQPIREINGKLVVYSLGNMVSNQRKRYTDGGILFGMTLEKSNPISEEGTNEADNKVSYSRKANAIEIGDKTFGTREAGAGKPMPERPVRKWAVPERAIRRWSVIL